MALLRLIQQQVETTTLDVVDRDPDGFGIKAKVLLKAGTRLQDPTIEIHDGAVASHAELGRMAHDKYSEWYIDIGKGKGFVLLRSDTLRSVTFHTNHPCKLGTLHRTLWCMYDIHTCTHARTYERTYAYAHIRMVMVG